MGVWVLLSLGLFPVVGLNLPSSRRVLFLPWRAFLFAAGSLDLKAVGLRRGTLGNFARFTMPDALPVEATMGFRDTLGPVGARR